MTPEERDELKALIRQEPTIAATFAEVDAAYDSVRPHYEAVQKRRLELSNLLGAIAQAKVRIAEECSPAIATSDESASETTTGEPEPTDSPAAKPTESGTEE